MFPTEETLAKIAASAEGFMCSIVIFTIAIILLVFWWLG